MTNSLTILRELEYRELGNLTMNGQVIDLGGSQKAGYQEIIKGDFKMLTANINADYGCDLIFDLEQVFPIESASYDGVVCFNVLEHVFDFGHVIKESSRILKPGGRIVIAAPFLYQIHGCPDDYFRFSESSLRSLLQRNGIETEKMVNLGFGVFSVLFQIVDGTTMLKCVPGVRVLLKKLSIGIDKLLARISGGYRGLSERVPLGYYVVGRKI